MCKKTLIRLAPGIFLLFLSACGDIQKTREQLEEAQDEIKSREVKRVSEGEIMQEAYKKGRKISARSQKAIKKMLGNALQRGGVPEAIKYCNVHAYPAVDSLSKEYGAEIKRVSLKTRNPKDKPDSVEKQVLEAYQYKSEKDQAPGDNVQFLKKSKKVLYTKPITINNSLCLNCHGKVGEDIDEENYNIIKKHYPQDKAVDYTIGDLRGMWSIKFDRKTLVQSMSK